MHLHFFQPPGTQQSSFVWYLVSIYSVPQVMLGKINVVFLLLVAPDG